jgi:hypothetical protein
MGRSDAKPNGQDLVRITTSNFHVEMLASFLPSMALGKDELGCGFWKRTWYKCCIRDHDDC